MKYEEKDTLMRAYVKLYVLLGTFGEDEDYFPKGKEFVQEKLAREAYSILDELLYGDEQS